jgi:membrane fusion protein (multidrug efflux system)
MSNQHNQEQKVLSAVPPAPAAAAPAAAAPAKSNRKVLVIAGALAAGGRMWYRSHNFVETENAYVTGHVHPVSARIPASSPRCCSTTTRSSRPATCWPSWIRPTRACGRADPGPDRQRRSSRCQADASVEQARPRPRPPAPRSRRRRPTWCAPSRTPSATASCTTPDEGRLEGRSRCRHRRPRRATADVTARRDNASAAKAQIAAAASARDVLKAQVKVLQAQLKDAQQQLGYNQHRGAGRAAASASAASKSARASSRASSWPPSSQDDVWVTANFKETQLAGLVPGQEVKINRRAAGQGTGRPRGQLLAGLGQPVRAAAGR